MFKLSKVTTVTYSRSYVHMSTFRASFVREQLGTRFNLLVIVRVALHFVAIKFIAWHLRQSCDFLRTHDVLFRAPGALLFK